MTRFKPHEAGIVNLWDYHLQTFRFEDGRLVLRGANGSGKTKALEVLVPFVLDGQLDPRRLDPFSGDSRSMRDNILWGRDKGVWSYAWVEFRRPCGAAVTIGVGMRATREGHDVKRWWFAVDRARGDGWDVVDADGAPLAEKALKAALGEGCMPSTAAGHRANVDRLLFGLGERYDALVELVLALRRPMLAKNLDLPMLDRTLRESLRPVDDDLVERSARAFEDLEAVAIELERLRKASDGAQQFLGTYRTYLLSTARKRLDDDARAREGLFSARAAAAAAVAAAAAAATAAAASTAARTEAEEAERQADQRLRGLLSSAAYQGHQQLEDLRGRVIDSRRRADLDRADAEVADGARASARTAAEKAGERLRRAVADHERGAAEAATAASEAGVASADPSLVEARRLELREVRSGADAWERAEDRAGRARERAEVAGERVQAAGRLVRRTEDATAQARGHWRQLLAGWAEGSPWVTPEGLDQLAGSVEAVGEPGAPTPAEALAGLVQPERDRLVVTRRDLQSQAETVRTKAAEVARQRAEVAAERDADPPPARSRQRSDGRAGAPLWRLVDFRPSVAAAERAGIEAALLASGLLDAWITPDGTVPTDEADGFAMAGPPVVGASLGVLLDPDGDDLPVAPEVVRGVLASIALGSGLCSVGVDGTYRLGALAGTAPTEEAGFVGAAARERRRARRLAELDGEFDRLAADVERLEGEQAAVDERLADLRRALEAFPSIAAVELAVQELARAATALAAAAEHRREAEAEADTEARAATGARRRFVDAAGAARLAATLEAITAAEVALHVLQRAVAEAAQLAAARSGAEEGAATAASTLAQAERRRAELSERARGSAGSHAEAAARLAAVEESLGAEAAQVAGQIREVRSTLDRAERTVPALRSAERTAGEAAVEARVRSEALGGAVGVAEQAEADADRLVQPFGRPDLVLACGLAADQPWRDALERASRGRSPSDDSLKQNRTAVLGGYDELEKRLGGRHPAHLDLDDTDLVVVTVDDETGPAPVAVFAGRLADQVAEQSAYLSAQERTVFEDALLSALVDQLHQRTQAARELVHGMNGVLVRHRTSSGLTVSLSWPPLEGPGEERRELLRLLEAGSANLTVDELDRVRRLLADAVRTARADHADERYRDVLAGVLDYRAWRTFELALDDGYTKERLTRQRYGKLSGGEKSVALHLPLFAAAHATFAGADPSCPRLLALDEAFEGIDENGRDELLALTVAFDLDLFLTGYRLWVVSPRVPAVAHYELVHEPSEHVVAAQRLVWNGRELVDDEEVA